MPTSNSKKSQEERLTQELRDFQRSNVANRRCFDCNEMMPQYVCLDFNTFVCTACSGIHREFAHRVKSISMSKFTESEVKNMIKLGGNEAAQKYWRAKHDPSFRPNGGNDGERTRNFIRLTYIDRKWVYESPRHKDEEPERTSSKGSKKKETKPSTTDSDDDFFSSSSKPAKSNSGATDAGFAQFGDFSQFESSSKPAAQPSFGDFSNFDAPTPSKKADDDFGAFGDFEGSTANSSTASASMKATPKAKPAPVARDFGSFKIAPPPGSHFSAASTSATSAPAASDLMGLSPTKKSDDPFGFDAPAPTSTTSAASTPFDAFDAPTPTNRVGSRSSSVSLDPFSDIAAPAAVKQQQASPFDAFGPPAGTSAPAPSFDDFSAPAPTAAASSNAFDAFGGGGNDFGDFTGSNSSSRTNSANPPVLDPFASKPEKPVTAAAVADPFSAFDDMQSSSASPAAAPPTPDFGAGNFSSPQAASSDPFGFGPGAPAQQQSNQPFGGFPGAPSNGNQFPQAPVMPQNAFNNQIQHPFGQGPPQQPQQQQWYGQQAPQQGFPGQQFPGQIPPRTAAPPPVPVHVKAPAPVASINDPFASLNIGGTFGFSNSGSSSGPPSRTNSGGAATTAPFAPTGRPGASSSFGSSPAAPSATGSIPYGQPQARASSSFTLPPQSNPAGFADPNAFGDFTSAPAQKPAANPFDLF